MLSAMATSLAVRNAARLEASRARSSAALGRVRTNAQAVIADLRGRNSEKLAAMKTLHTAAAVSQVAGAVVAGQVARIDPFKNAEGKGKGMMINYGLGALGLVMLVRGPKSKTEILAASVAIGMAAGQAAIDSYGRDLWPFDNAG